MKVINKLESYPTGDMLVPYCPNCNNPTYSERKCPFCNTELEYEEIIEKDKEIERLSNIINELENYLNEQVNYMTHNSIERMVAFDCCRHKLQELRGSDK